MNNAPVLSCAGIKKTFGGDVAVLDGVSFALRAGETFSITGASGSGKTTLLHILGGLDMPDAGWAAAGEKKWGEMNAKEAAKWRNRMLGFVFQFHLLLPEFSALENAAMPLLIRRRPRAEALDEARKHLRRLGLAAHENKRPGMLSGGERQRVAVARALAGNPACILADEPTGNLDRKNAEAVFALMLGAAAENKTAIIVATHDEHLAAQTGKRAALIDGKLDAAHENI
ncbi:MAG: ABC transporter ATP-binding protein [Gammaproteobacteria bacterium]